ncbi:MAG: hypothetical protein HPZ86_05980 [Clostridia bacterium]|nr:hypothetical protein [Clostridia bacterium]
MAEKRSGRRGERGRGNGNERGYPRRRSEKRMQRAGGRGEKRKRRRGREGDTYTRQGKVWEGVKKELYVRRGDTRAKKLKKKIGTARGKAGNEKKEKSA